MHDLADAPPFKMRSAGPFLGIGKLGGRLERHQLEGANERTHATYILTGL